MTWVKFCGCLGAMDATMAQASGADAFGMIFSPSPRRIAWQSAVEIAGSQLAIEPVAVFVNPPVERVDAVLSLFPRAQLQFAGDETPEFVERYAGRAIKTIHVDPTDDAEAIERACSRFSSATLLFDTKVEALPGGTGKTFPWEIAVAAATSRRVVVAGGLNAGNVAACIRTVRPFGVDVRSGIEIDQRKDAARMEAFVRAVREADAAPIA